MDGHVVYLAIKLIPLEFLSALPVATIWILMGALSSAGDIYIAPDGSDDNPGTLQKPLRTPGAAVARRADVVILRGGTYRLDAPLVFGAEESGQTWKAYNDEVPVLSGGVLVSGWKADGYGRFKAVVEIDNFRQLWVDGRRAKRARGKVPAGLKLWGTHEATVREGANPPGLSGTPGYLPGTLENFGAAGYTTADDSLADWKNPGDIEFGYYKSWTHMIAKVENITRSDGGALIVMSQPGFFLCHRKGGTQAKEPAYIENALELLDEPGEWYFDRPSQTLYYMPREGEYMGSCEVIAPKLESLVEVRGSLERPVRDLTFEGLTFAHATWLRPSSKLGHPDLQANFIQPIDNSYFRPEADKGWVPVNGEAVKSPANVVVDAGHGIRFDSCTFTALGGAGLDLQNGSQSNTVSACHFYDISGTAIQVGDITREDHHPSDPRRVVKGNRITNNNIQQIGVEYTGSVGIFYGYTDGTIIAHNDISSVPYSGVSGGWGWGQPDAGGSVYRGPVIYQSPTSCRDNLVEFNHIHDLVRVRNDGGGVYTLGRQPGTIIRGNHIHDTRPGRIRCGVYLDDGSADIEVTDNVIYRMPKPLNFNNRNQNRIATCQVHDNHLFAPVASAPGVKGLALKGCSTLDVEHDPRLDPAQFTITAWIRLDRYPMGEDARRWVVCKAANEWVDGNISLFVDHKNISGSLNVGGGRDNCYIAAGEGEPLLLNTWMPVALTYDGDNLRVYCGEKAVGIRRIGQARSSSSNPLTLGARGDRFSTFDCGDIDEITIYDRVLTGDELGAVIRSIHAGEALPSSDGLVRAWTFEDLPTESRASKIAEKAGLETTSVRPLGE